MMPIAYGANVRPRVEATIDQVEIALAQNDRRWLGYEDYRTGLPVRHEAATQLEQLGYEEGRAMAAEFTTYGPLPAWTDWRRPPPELVQLVRRWQRENPGAAALPPEFKVVAHA